MTETTLTIRDTKFGIFASGFGCARYSEEDLLNVAVRLLKKLSDGDFTKLVDDLRSGFSPASLEKQAVAEVVKGWSKPPEHADLQILLW
ncbi:MAG: hypothetical protein OQK35_07515 [Alphaproteobacteria bacterium]|nr:hypothetical protein [Rhodospirillales bacterium]MCW9046166.1 hypothetical protein [Alphaproteobacteria bacterium]